MNETRWLMELEGIRIHKERKFEELVETAKVIKDSVIHLLGLNLMPVMDEETGLWRRPNDNEIMPLLAAIAREDVVKTVAERYNEMEIQQQVSEEIEAGVGIIPPEELDEFMGDIEFIDDEELMRKKSVWDSKETKQYLKQSVLPLEEKDSIFNVGVKNLIDLDEKVNFILTEFEPLKYNNQLFGKSVEFYHTKRHVKFTSEFHAPDYLQYDQITSIEIRHDPKKWLLYLGILTLIVFIGIFLFYLKVHLPPWDIIIHVKHRKPVSIRTRFTQSSPELMVAACSPNIPISITGLKQKTDQSPNSLSQSKVV